MLATWHLKAGRQATVWSRINCTSHHRAAHLPLAAMLAPGAFFARRRRHVHFSVNEGGDAPSSPGSPAGKGPHPTQAPPVAAAFARLRRGAALLAPGAPLAQVRCPRRVSGPGV